MCKKCWYDQSFWQWHISKQQRREKLYVKWEHRKNGWFARIFWSGKAVQAEYNQRQGEGGQYLDKASGLKPDGEMSCLYYVRRPGGRGGSPAMWPVSDERPAGRQIYNIRRQCRLNIWRYFGRVWQIVIQKQIQIIIWTWEEQAWHYNIWEQLQGSKVIKIWGNVTWEPSLVC